MEVEKVKEALRFICSSDFLRMALFWNLALISSYFQLLKRRIFGSKPTSFSSSSSSLNTSSSHRPICVITGASHFFSLLLAVWCNLLTALNFICLLLHLQATSGLGKATAFALSTKGFYVVLGTKKPVTFTLKQSIWHCSVHLLWNSRHLLIWVNVVADDNLLKHVLFIAQYIAYGIYFLFINNMRQCISRVL